mgnify:CR=1 FL=1
MAGGALDPSGSIKIARETGARILDVVTHNEERSDDVLVRFRGNRYSLTNTLIYIIHGLVAPSSTHPPIQTVNVYI